MFMGLDAINQTLILKEIVHFELKLMQGISIIQVEHDSNNEAMFDLIPPMMSFQLVKMALCDFIDSVFDPYRSQLAKFYPMKRLISLNDINKNSSMLIRGNPAPSSSLISKIYNVLQYRMG